MDRAQLAKQKRVAEPDGNGGDAAEIQNRELEGGRERVLTELSDLVDLGPLERNGRFYWPAVRIV